MLRRWPPALIGAFFAALWISAAIAAASFPPLTGRVVDQAKILSPVTAADLERKLADLEQKSGIQLVVATVPSLGGEEIEPYANALFRAWKLGEAKKNNGALLLIAPNERRVRIEVGYGLEGTLTDAVSSIIIANAIAPSSGPALSTAASPGASTTSSRARPPMSAEWKPKPTDMRAEHDASLLDAIAVPHFPVHHVRDFAHLAAGRRRQRDFHSDGRRAVAAADLAGAAAVRRRLFRRRRLVGRRRRLGRLVMILDPAETARVEAAFDAAQLKTRAPLVCVLAGASQFPVTPSSRRASQRGGGCRRRPPASPEPISAPTRTDGGRPRRS